MSDHPSPSGKLIVSREGPVTTITLNRPECHNALDREVSAELNAAVKGDLRRPGLSHRDPSRGR